VGARLRRVSLGPVAGDDGDALDARDDGPRDPRRPSGDRDGDPQSVQTVVYACRIRDAIEYDKITREGERS